MVKLYITDTDGTEHTLDAETGISVMEAAVDADLDIRAECGGSLACATCHMFVDKEWLDKIGDKSEDEEDMLDFADGVVAESRLSCQIEVTEEIDGFRATIAPPM